MGDIIKFRGKDPSVEAAFLQLETDLTIETQFLTEALGKVNILRGRLGMSALSLIELEER